MNDWLLKLLVVLVLILGAGGAWMYHDMQRAQAEAALAHTAVERKMVTDALAAQAQQTESLIVASQSLTRYIDTGRTILRDTAFVHAITHPVTRSDTIASLVELPKIIARLDTTQRKCSEFVVSCDRYRAQTETTLAAYRLQVTGLEHALTTATSAGRAWAGWPDLVYGVGCTIGDGRPCSFRELRGFVGVGGRIGK